MVTELGYTGSFADQVVAWIPWLLISKAALVFLRTFGGLPL